MTIKNSAHNGTTFKKNAYLCTVIPKTGGGDTEESYEALTRQRIWKIQAYGREAEKAVPPTVAYIACSHQGRRKYISVGVS